MSTPSGDFLNPRAVEINFRQRAAWITVASGAFAAGTGGAAIVGWHLKIPALVQWHADWPVMAYLTALIFTACGLSLVAYASRWPRFWVVLGGGLSGLLAMAWLLENQFGWPLGMVALEGNFPTLARFPVIQPSPATATCLTLLGVGITSLGLPLPRKAQRLMVWISGALALAPYAMVLGGYLSGFLAWENLQSPSGMAINTLIAMMALGFSLLATQMADGIRFVDDPWLPVPLTILVAASSVIFWSTLNTAQHETTQNKADALAYGLASSTLSHVNPSLRALERMKLRWEQEGGTPQKEWEADADAHLRIDNGFVSVQRTDATGMVIWSRPEAGADQRLGRNIYEDQRWEVGAALTEGLRKRSLVVSPVLPLSQGSLGIKAYFPIFAKDAFDGWIIGVIPFNEMTRSAMRSALLSDATVSVFEDDHLIFGPMPNTPPRDVQGDAKLNFFGHHWRFIVEIHPSAIAGHNLPRVTLILGLLLAGSLGLAVRAFQQVAWTNREIHAANRQLHRLANEDYLTGLINRRYFDEILHGEIERARRHQRPVSAIMADVDYFKRYNDHYGHLLGDECLRRVAAVFKRTGRDGDSIGRYGGEEFCAVLPDTDGNGAHEMAERIRSAVEALQLPHELHPAQRVTLSLGVACLDFSKPVPAEAASAGSLLAAADAALYAAKEAGRNQVK